MRNKLVVLTIMLTLSIILSGCISEKQQINGIETEKNITIKYIEKDNPVITKENFQDFKPIDRIYYISRENTSLTLQTEGNHGSLIINDSDKIPEGYRIYGVSEAYNLSERYLLLQYKVFDNDEKLNDSMNMTVFDYIKGGFRHRLLNDTYKGRVFVLESNTSNKTNMNVAIILFGYDTVIGKIGVQDFKDRSTNESLEILNGVFDKLIVSTKDVKAANIEMYGFDKNMVNKSYKNTMNRSYRKYYENTN